MPKPFPYMKESIVMNKSYAFALRIVKCYQFLLEQRQEYILSKQLLRSGTAIGALVKEGEHAQSKADFISKMSIALKEANEASYWLMLLHDSNYLPDNIYMSLESDCKELLKLLACIVKTTKERMKH